MSASNQETVKETGRTPSMVTSLLVIGVMIALILLSVVLFGSEVAEGALQVSMTLATLFALSVALYYGFRGAVISDAIMSSVNGTIGTIFVLSAFRFSSFFMSDVARHRSGHIGSLYPVRLDRFAGRRSQSQLFRSSPEGGN